MIVLAECRSVLSSIEISDNYFLKQHFYMEGYLKRLLFIGLRLNSVQYKMAQDVIAAYHEPLEKMIERAWSLSGFDYKHDVSNYGNYKSLEIYFVKFTAKYRNYRVHGVYDKIKDDELLELLITINFRYFNICNSYINSKGRPSVFNEPKDWGAKKGLQENMAQVYSRLLNNIKPKVEIYTKEDIRKWLNENP